jgi:hypothetical protein
MGNDIMKKTLLTLALLAGSALSTQAAVLLTEGFNDITDLGGKGWVQTNNSAPLGSTGWFQGNSGIFEAASGAPPAYIAANFNNSDPLSGTVSNWLITPVVNIANGTSMSFALRLLGETFLDTVEVYYSTSGGSADIGSTSSSIGVFSLLQTYASDTDTDWVNEIVTLSGLGGPTTGRFAFRYVVADTFDAGNYIGIDTVSIEDNAGVSVVPEPGSLVLLGLGLLGVAAIRKYKQA